jgi:DNA repair exonuclease SbcCD nuclease subunit
MVKLIIHTGDIHIRIAQRKEEYAEQLDKFVEKCKILAEPYERDEVRIVICGDLGHSKNQITPHYITLTSLFIRKLEEVGKVIAIAGNHDLIEGNTSKIDAITSIFETAKFNNALFLDEMLGYESGCVMDENITWAVYSIYDGYLRPNIDEVKKDNPNNKVIGLYHGMIVGSTMPNGTVVDEGVDGDVFEGCDCVMAAHIHKRQELKRGNTEIIYCGSLIQQTFGETVSQHGFVKWDVETMQHEYVDLDTDYGLYDIEISSENDIEEDKERLINF